MSGQANAVSETSLCWVRILGAGVRDSAGERGCGIAFRQKPSFFLDCLGVGLYESVVQDAAQS